MIGVAQELQLIRIAELVQAELLDVDDHVEEDGRHFRCEKVLSRELIQLLRLYHVVTTLTHTIETHNIHCIAGPGTTIVSNVLHNARTVTNNLLIDCVSTHPRNTRSCKYVAAQEFT